jgi:hypothetical protein
MRTALTTTVTAATVGAVAALALGVGPSAAGDGQRSSAAPAALSVTLLSGSGGDADLTVVGLAGHGTQLTRISTDKPSRARATVTVVGLQGDTRLVGIDYRVQDGSLYGLGEAGGVYRLDPRRGTATLVVRLSAALQGSAFGVDFNPVANALRVVSDTGQNLRQSFATVDGAYPATSVDTSLAYAAGTTATGVTGAGYTNNDTDPGTATTLFDIDTTLDQVAVQSPANAGSLSPTGKLGVDFSGDVGFDVYSVVRDGTAVDLIALAVDQGTLYEVTLLNGRARALGAAGKGDVTDIAVPLGQL